ncbi:hypothetical protein KGQ20_41650 [Catenulispora sp. NF23]|uniref:GHMP kinase N-terminal domain-containing protein n=1 Tax=Catenulispora pinistramenti TaxID=2705254 RepID=A0ABS5L7E3_9ACTN|nr:hypothetical protein [Catenulispora pinistramenti]MBS2539270.1 hypothetical protein [Catenulispora pinistramenti]MBS2554248.1 hypothetical protein [Catenulispora pinistramenti]
MGEDPVNQSTVRIGAASAPIHHGEVLQGAFRVDGRIHRGLVTLPCRLYRAQAKFAPEIADRVRVRPPWRRKALRGAELALREVALLTGERFGGYLEVDSDVPLCRGFGSSTSDVLASIYAVADAFGLVLPRETVARITVEAEGASDSLMFEQTAVLFAHREGELIEDFGAELPPVHVLGFGTGDPVDTLSFTPARYDTAELDRFDELRSMLRHAVAAQDAALMGEVATASTRINQKHLPIPHLEAVCAAATEVGAVGVHTAHSGDIGGLMFDRYTPDLGPRVETARRLLRDLGYDEQWRFTTGD